MGKKLLRNDRFSGILVSLFAHLAIIICGGFAFAKPLEYAVEAGSGGMEISLTAAPAEIQAPALEVPIPVQDETEKMEAPEEVKPAQGSSAAGKDKITFYSAGGAITEAKPNYLRNPAPPYPWEARQNGWQGVVLLKVSVDRSRRAVTVEKEHGSGYDVLDQSALKTVKNWRFRPAQMGAMPVESTVLVPIRFELENLKK